jgi:murein DD-endopeptidase MepM/ murein hydrolase activator NlpD/tetratricopeptide (TPR) repeat protein
MTPTDSEEPAEKTAKEQRPDPDASDSHTQQAHSSLVGRNSDRRAFLRTAAVGLTTGVAGCQGGAQTREYEAEPVSLAATATEKGYSRGDTSTSEVSRSIEAAGQTLEVVLTNHFAGYEHRSGETVGLVSTPAPTAAGRSLNPVASEPLEELLTRDIGAAFLDRLDIAPNWARGPTAVENGEGQVLGASVDFTVFAGVTQNSEFVLLSAARTEDGSDAVLVGTARTTTVKETDRPFVGAEGFVGAAAVTEQKERFRTLLPLVRHGQPADTPSEQSPATPTGQLLEDPAADQTWVEYSERLVAARESDDPTRINDALREEASALDNRGLAMVFEFWTAENLRVAGRHEEAASRYSELLDRYQEASFRGMDFRDTMLEKRAGTEARLGEVDEALATYDELIEHRDGNLAWPFYRQGLIAERDGRDETAIEAYERAATEEDTNNYSLFGVPELAARCAERVRDPFDGFFDDESKLREQIARRIEDGDYEALRSLASPTHFTTGATGGCRDFADPEGVLEQVIADAERSEISVDRENVTTAGKSVYVHTEGWEGDVFSERVDIILRECPQGWEWTGITVRVPEAIEDIIERWRKWNPEHWTDTDDDAEDDGPPTDSPTPTPTPTDSPTPKSTDSPTPTPATGNTATMDVAAPYPSGQHFRAGGLPVPVATGGGCGTGMPGFFYDFGPTHQANPENAKYAIDFTQYQFKNLRNTNSALNTKVLSTNDGVVDRAIGGNANGGDDANFVDVNHPKGVLGSNVNTDYRSRYMDLTGPGDLKVSRGTRVKTGTYLGKMDNTGNSALHHLHFKIVNQHTGDSVKPTPMNGHTLAGGSDNGTCVKSSTGKRP